MNLLNTEAEPALGAGMTGVYLHLCFWFVLFEFPVWAPALGVFTNKLRPAEAALAPLAAVVFAPVAFGLWWVARRVLIGSRHAPLLAGAALLVIAAIYVVIAIRTEPNFRIYFGGRAALCVAAAVAWFIYGARRAPHAESATR